jgi:hypothetical protein
MGCIEASFGNKELDILDRRRESEPPLSEALRLTIRAVGTP